jgi:prenyltransferase beta subunit
MKWLPAYILFIPIALGILCPDYSLAQTVEISNGISYLQSNQGADGSWGGTAGATTDFFPSTTTALDALKLLEATPSANQTSAIQYLAGQTLSETDYLSRRVLSLIGTGSSIPGDLTTILSYQNLDKGWGGSGGFTTDVLDTALALLAISSDGSVSPTLKSQVVSFLLSRQYPDGSWGLTSDQNKSLLVTALVMEALETQPQTTAIANALANGTAFLLAHQNPDGGFGESPSTVWETAQVFLAISKTTGDAAVRTAAIDYLLAQQQANGSWDDDPYSTALALQALVAAQNQTGPPPPPTTGTITGTVADGTTHAPLSGVLVEITSLGLSATTNSSGAFTLSNVAAGGADLTFTKAGYAVGTVSVTVGAGDVLAIGTIYINPNPDSGIVSGTATNASDGTPLSGVLITVTGAVPLTATTGADGTYTITDVPSGAVTFSATQSGYLDANGSGTVIQGGVLTFSPALTPAPTAGTVTGAVTDSDTGLPIEGATIDLTGTATDSAVTGPDGSYTFTNVPAGAINLSASASGYDPVSTSGTLTAGLIVYFSPALTPTGSTAPTTGTISGTVTDAGTGLPIDQANVDLSGAASGSVLTDASGTYQFADLAEGSYTVTISMSGYQTATATGLLTAGGAMVVNAALQPVPTTGTIQGTVVDAVTGDPIPLAGILLLESGASTGTDVQGGFELADVPEGTYTVTITATGYASQTVNVVLPGGATADLGVLSLTAMAGSTTLTGVVTDASTGNPIPNATVLLDETNSAVTTDADGYYSLDNIELSAFTLKVTAYGYAGTAEMVTLSEPGILSLNFALTPRALSDLSIVSVSTDSADYPAQAVSTVTVDVENHGAVPVDGTISIRVEDQNGTIVDLKNLNDGSSDLGVEVITFNPGEAVTRTLNWMTQQKPPGDYVITAKLVEVVDVTADGFVVGQTLGSILSEASVPAAILPTPLLSGVMIPDPPMTLSGTGQAVQWGGEIRNAGNVPLDPTAVNLAVTKVLDPAPSFTGTVTLPALAVGQFVPVDFGSWTPSDSGHYDVTGSAADPSVGFSISQSYYVGPGVAASLTVDPPVVLASGSPQTVAASLQLTHLDPPANSALAPGPTTVGIWHLDGNALDATGAHDGTNVGADCTRVLGKFSGACEFFGDDYFAVPDAPDLVPSTLTLEAWVKFTGIQTQNTIIGKGGGSADYQLRVAPSGGQPRFMFRLRSINLYSSTAVTPDTWYHVAATYDGSAMKIYVNGVLEKTYNFTGGIPAISEPLGIGANFASGAWKNFFSGVIDEAAVHNTALDAATIASHAVDPERADDLVDVSVVSAPGLAYSNFSESPGQSVAQADGTTRYEWNAQVVGAPGRLITWDVAVPPMALGAVQAVATSAEMTLTPDFVPARIIVPFASGFLVPAGLVFDSQGNLYVANGLDTYTNYDTVSKVTPDGVVSTFASGFNHPTDLAFDSAGNLYVTNRFGNSVSKVAPDGTVSTFASPLFAPAGIVIDSQDNLYVGERDLGRISRVTPEGVIEPFAQLPNRSSTLLTLAFGPDDENFLFAAEQTNYGGTPQKVVYRVSSTGDVSVFATGFDRPSGMILDPQGNLLVVNRTNGWVFQVSPDGMSRDDYIRGLDFPTFITLDASGIAFVSERDLREVVKLIPNPDAIPVTVGIDTPALTASGLVSVSAATDQSSYPADADVLVSGELTNQSLITRDLTVRTLIEDADGNEVTALADQAVTALGPGTTAPLSDSWNTGTTLSGAYQAHVIVLENGLEMAGAIAPFTIEAGLDLAAATTTDKINYNANDTVTVNAAITSNSPNATFTGVTATVTITDPSAAVLYTETQSLQDLLPGARADFKSFWNTETNPAGGYTASLSVTTDQGIIATSAAGFTIVSSLEQAQSLAGAVTVAPDTIIEGETADLAYTVQNIGNDVDIPDVTIEILVVDPVTGLVARTLTETASLNDREVYENAFSFNSTGLPPVTHLLILRGVVGTAVQTLGSVALIINPLPNSAPFADAGPDTEGFVGQPATLDGSASFDPEDDPLTFTWAFDSVPADSALTAADINGADTATPTIVPDVVGTYTLSLVVSDGQFNSQTDLVSVFVSPPVEIDLHPETINLKSHGGATSVTVVLFSPVLSSFETLTGADGVTVTAAFSLTHTYTDSLGTAVSFDTPVTDYPGDDTVVAVDLDGDGTTDGWQLTLKVDRQNLIAGFLNPDGTYRIADSTELTSTVFANGIQVGSDVNTALPPNK